MPGQSLTPDTSGGTLVLVQKQSSQLLQDFLCEETLLKWPWSPGGFWVMVKCRGLRKALEQGESSTQRLCQGNGNLFPFPWLKSSWRYATAAGGVASSWVRENSRGCGVSSPGHAGVLQKSGLFLGQEQRGCSPEQMDLLLPPSAPALPGAGPALSRRA